MPGKPLWRRAVDSADSTIAPHLESFTTSTFIDVARTAITVRRGIQGLVDRRTKVVWHLLNLPAGSDIKRLSRQVASLDRELRQLRGEVSRQIEDENRGRDS